MNKLLTRTGSQSDINHIAFVDFSRRARTRSVHVGDASSETIRSEKRWSAARWSAAKQAGHHHVLPTWRLTTNWQSEILRYCRSSSSFFPFDQVSHVARRKYIYSAYTPSRRIPHADFMYSHGYGALHFKSALSLHENYHVFVTKQPLNGAMIQITFFVILKSMNDSNILIKSNFTIMLPSTKICSEKS